MRSQTYVCPSCKRTKTITADHSESTREFMEDLPESLECDYCDEEMKP